VAIDALAAEMLNLEAPQFIKAAANQSCRQPPPGQSYVERSASRWEFLTRGFFHYLKYILVRKVNAAGV
jgi:hypothetical protein